MRVPKSREGSAGVLDLAPARQTPEAGIWNSKVGYSKPTDKRLLTSVCPCFLSVYRRGCLLIRVSLDLRQSRHVPLDLMMSLSFDTAGGTCLLVVVVLECTQRLIGFTNRYGHPCLQSLVSPHPPDWVLDMNYSTGLLHDVNYSFSPPLQRYAPLLLPSLSSFPSPSIPSLTCHGPQVHACRPQPDTSCGRSAEQPRKKQANRGS